MNSQRDNACKSLAKVSFGYAPRFASMPRMTILIFAIFQVSGFDFCPKMETLSLRPLCVSMNFMDCTNIPQDPQQESQRCLYLILSNDSRDFEHPCVQKQIGNCKRHNYPFMRKNIKKEIPRCIAKCKLHTLKESFLSFNLI